MLVCLAGIDFDFARRGLCLGVGVWDWSLTVRLKERRVGVWMLVRAGLGGVVTVSFRAFGVEGGFVGSFVGDRLRFLAESRWSSCWGVVDGISTDTRSRM